MEDIAEVLQALYLDGWFRPDITQYDSEWVSLSEYGRSQLELDYVPQYLDPVATIRDLKISIDNIDEVALDYFAESLLAIKKQLYLSATITMGCASERTILLLIERVVEYCSDSTVQKEIDKKFGIKNKFDVIKKLITAKDFKKKLLDQYKGDKRSQDELERIFIDIDTMLEQMFSIYRINRNEAGHPTGRKFNECIVKSNAAMFKKYCEVTYGLMKYLST